MKVTYSRVWKIQPHLTPSFVIKIAFLLRKVIALVFLFVCFILFMITTCLHVSAWRLINSVIKFSSFPFSAKHSQSEKSLFSSRKYMLHSAITESIGMNSHRELYCTNAISLQVINSIYPSFNALSREISKVVILYL